MDGRAASGEPFLYPFERKDDASIALGSEPGISPEGTMGFAVCDFCGFADGRVDSQR
jgi:hypothetical protein